VATSSALETHTLTRQSAPLEAPALLRLWHLTSLDAPTVAFVWTLAFAWAAHVDLDLRIPAALALATWSIYIGDRLLDAHRAGNMLESEPFLRERHHFHWHHRRVLIPVALASATAALALIALVIHSIPLAARERNIVLVAATAAYFTSVHSRRLSLGKIVFPLRLPKELLVGILFTLACAAPAWTRIATNRLYLIPPILCFIALAWLNCHAIESWESSPPGRSRIFRPATVVAATTLPSAILTAALGQYAFASLLATASLSAALLAFLDRVKSRLTPITLRVAADLVLLTPAALLVLRFFPAHS
jgi:hypothetical protein